jgi:hypothetical protein
MNKAKCSYAALLRKRVAARVFHGMSPWKIGAPAAARRSRIAEMAEV